MTAPCLWLVFVLASLAGYFFKMWRREWRRRLALEWTRREILNVREQAALALVQRNEIQRTLRALHLHSSLTPSAKELAAELARVHERWAADQEEYRQRMGRIVARVGLLPGW